MNYFNTFIGISSDTAARTSTIPPARTGKKSIALLEYELISTKPYTYTQEEVQFAVHLSRLDLSAKEQKSKRDVLWREFFAKPIACMRTSPLAKTYGWGLHFDAEGKVALVAMESKQYQKLSANSSLKQVHAMRSKRA